jgi:hypothetical protein
LALANNSWVGSTANFLKIPSDNTGFSLNPVPSHEQAKQNFKVALFFLWKILGYLQILVWLIHTQVQDCIKEYQTLPFFDGIFATVFGQLDSTNINTYLKIITPSSKFTNF